MLNRVEPSYNYIFDAEEEMAQIAARSRRKGFYTETSLFEKFGKIALGAEGRKQPASFIDKFFSRNIKV